MWRSRDSNQGSLCGSQRSYQLSYSHIVSLNLSDIFQSYFPKFWDINMEILRLEPRTSMWEPEILPTELFQIEIVIFQTTALTPIDKTIIQVHLGKLGISDRIRSLPTDSHWPLLDGDTKCKSIEICWKFKKHLFCFSKNLIQNEHMLCDIKSL